MRLSDTPAQVRGRGWLGKCPEGAGRPIHHAETHWRPKAIQVADAAESDSPGIKPSEKPEKQGAGEHAAQGPRGVPGRAPSPPTDPRGGNPTPKRTGSGGGTMTPTSVDREAAERCTAPKP